MEYAVKRKKAVLSTGLAVVLLIVVLHPFLWLILSTFKNESDIIQYPPTFFAGMYTFMQYMKVWKSIPLLNFIWNTVIYAGSVVVISSIVDSMAGYAFARIKFRFRDQLFVVILISMMIPSQVLMIPLFLEEHKLGILNTYAGLILPKTADAFGIFLMRSFFVSLPKELEEAARIDGLDEFRILFKIMLPLCVPGMLTCAVFNFVGSWNDLLYPLMMTSSTEMRTLSAGLAISVGDRTIEYGPTLAASLISLIPLILIYIFGQKYFVQSFATAGIKG